MSFIGNLAGRIGLRERRKDGRVPTQGIEVFYAAGAEQRQLELKDISPTGLSVAAEDGWNPGVDVQLILRRKSPVDRDFGMQVRIPAKVVHVDAQSAGLMFVNAHVNRAGWSKLVVKAANLSTISDGIRAFRIAKALALLQRISPSAEGSFLQTITDGLSNEVAERALEILLNADDLLSSRGCSPRKNAAPRLIQCVVDYGVRSDTRDEAVEQAWAGLLASSLVEESDDRSSLEFVELLSKLDAVTWRILSAGCERAMAVGWEPGFVFSKSIVCSADEIKNLSGTKSLSRIGWAISSLNGLALLETTSTQLSLDPITEANLTPTALGLQLYTRCRGQLEAPDLKMAGSGTVS